MAWKCARKKREEPVKDRRRVSVNSFDNYETWVTEPEEPVQGCVGLKRPWGQKK